MPDENQASFEKEVPVDVVDVAAADDEKVGSICCEWFFFLRMSVRASPHDTSRHDSAEIRRRHRFRAVSHISFSRYPPIFRSWFVPFRSRSEMRAGFCCCDFRSAVVVSGLIQIVYCGIMAVLTATGITTTGAIAMNNDNPDAVGDVAFGATVSDLLAIGWAFGVVSGVCQLVAALRYIVWLLSTCLVCDLAALWYTTFFYWQISESVGAFPGSIVVNGIGWILIITYPICGLLKEINAGTMSEETYHREAHGCCHDRRRRRTEPPQPDV